MVLINCIKLYKIVLNCNCNGIIKCKVQWIGHLPIRGDTVQCHPILPDLKLTLIQGKKSGSIIFRRCLNNKSPGCQLLKDLGQSEFHMSRIIIFDVQSDVKKKIK